MGPWGESTRARPFSRTRGLAHMDVLRGVNACGARPDKSFARLRRLPVLPTRDDRASNTCFRENGFRAFISDAIVYPIEDVRAAESSRESRTQHTMIGRWYISCALAPSLLMTTGVFAQFAASDHPEAWTAWPHDIVATMSDAELMRIPEEQRPRLQCSMLRTPGSETQAGFQAESWPDGIVPYTFAGNVSTVNQDRTLDAMAEIEAVTSVHFIPRTFENDYLIINSSSQNSSFVGRIGGAQVVNIFNWATRFIIVHELMHALAFEHEHQRTDRDQYIEVELDNVCCGAEFNFIMAGGVTNFGPYDFDSVMHYGQYAFSNGSPCCQPEDRTITVLPPNEQFQSTIGQREYLSAGDIDGLRAVYEGYPVELPFFEDFESGGFEPLTWVATTTSQVLTAAGSGSGGVFSANLDGSSQGGEQLRTGVMDTEGASFIFVSYAFQRGGPGNSPEGGEDLVVEYRDTNGNWIEVDRQLGFDPDTSTFETTEFIIDDPAALHETFRLRFRAISGSTNQDDWYIDDIVVALPPANNRCTFADRVFVGDTPVDTTFADTQGEMESCGPIERDLWYFVVAPCDGILTISVCDATFDAQLALYGILCPSLPDEAIVCSDDDCGNGPSISIPVVADDFYRIRLGSADGTGGPATLSVDCSAGAACPADCSPDNGDGTYGNGVVNVDDLFAVLQSFDAAGGPCDIAPDNGDGTFGNGIVNIDDLLAVLDAFGDCP